jgi:molybdate-binding protein/DNA-binding XRE family transcriptional regulator
MSTDPQTSGIRSKLGAIRRARGISAAELASAVGVTRQAIHSIETGSYVPNTAIALRLARVLDIPVEELFSLAVEPEESANPVFAEALSAKPLPAGFPVILCDVGTRRIAVPVQAAPCYLPEADAVVTRPRRGKAELMSLPGQSEVPSRLVIAGCDPAIGIAGAMIDRTSGVEVIPVTASSRLALEWLRDAKVHIAGAHLRDTATGEFNLPVLKRLYPRDDFAVVTFAHWQEGIVCAPGNPKGIRDVTDLENRAIRFRNRERGSGSRALLDRLLKEAGIPPARVTGYDRLAHGHLAAAYAVLTGECDACLATQSAARAFGLDFIPIERERYDFVLKRKTLELPAVQVFLDVLQRAALRRKLQVQAGYETGSTGSVLA